MTAIDTPAPTLDPSPTPEAFQERMLASVGGLFDVFGMYLGHRLGYYRALADSSRALTSVELAERTDTAERYTREWLEQQTVSGVLAVEDERAPARERRYALPAGAAVVLTESDALEYLAPLAQLAVGAVRPIERLVEAYRTGSGVAYGAYGADLRRGQAEMNRVMFRRLLPERWLPSVPDVDARLRGSSPARVADLGCGLGHSSVGIARGYPNVRVDRFDLDAASIEEAQSLLEREHAEVADRVAFHCRDAADPALGGRYDLVVALECVHDMGHPVEALRTMRRLAGEDGAVIVADERVEDAFTAAGNEVEWFMYGWSMLHCLPVGIADCDGPGGCCATGTVMRPPVLRGFASEAGFSRVEILPIEHDFLRFYRLHR